MAMIFPFIIARQLPLSGFAQITGIVDELGVVGAYRVAVYHRITGLKIAETWSIANGAYAVDYLPYEPFGYFAVAFDHGDNPVNAAIADYLTPVPMP
jgi:hypothetical protein